MRCIPRVQDGYRVAASPRVPTLFFGIAINASRGPGLPRLRDWIVRCMTATLHSVQLFEASCRACHRTFAMPLLSDFSYGQFIFHGERGSVFGYLQALEDSAWEDMTARLQRIGLFPSSATSEQIDHFHRVVAASTDAISGQRLVSYPICPSCQSHTVSYGDSTPSVIREIPAVTFEEYLALPDATRTQRLLQLWKACA